MTPGERFKAWIDGLAGAWGDRLKGWMASWVMRGVNELLEELEPEAIELVRSNLSKVTEHPATPQDLKDIISLLTAGKKPLPLLLLIPLGVLLIIPTITSIFQPLGNLLRYAQERLFKSARFDPIAVITAWRRDPVKYERLFSDLKDQGWSDDSIEAFKFITLYYPAPADLVRWQAREVFEPEMIERYGLDSEYAAIKKEPFYKAGMTDEQILNYWRAHWEHASWTQVIEMLHRGLMTEEEIWDWFRLVEIPPFWRQKLIDSAYNVPTRVDVRRFYDLKTIDEARLREIYSAQGYTGKNLDDYVLWTKIYVDLPDLLARWKNGWITLDEVRARLIADGMGPAAADELIETKVKAEVSDATKEGLELTKTEIYKGIKLGKLSQSQGVELVQALGYNLATARFLVAINTEVLAGSPETFMDFQDIVEKYRESAGLDSKPVSEELKAAAAELVQLTGEVESLREAVKLEEKTLIPEEALPEAATERLTELQVALHRAEAELARVKTDYAALLAEWRQQEAK